MLRKRVRTEPINYTRFEDLKGVGKRRPSKKTKIKIKIIID